MGEGGRWRKDCDTPDNVENMKQALLNGTILQNDENGGSIFLDGPYTLGLREQRLQLTIVRTSTLFDSVTFLSLQPML